VPLDKLPDLVLVYNISNYFFCEVSNYLTSRKEISFSQTIDLINKDTFLSISKILVNLVLEYYTGGSFALNTLKQYKKYEIIVSSDLSIIRIF
jgi:hypothetical protein